MMDHLYTTPNNNTQQLGRFNQKPLYLVDQLIQLTNSADTFP